MSNQYEDEFLKGIGKSQKAARLESENGRINNRIITSKHKIKSEGKTRLKNEGKARYKPLSTSDKIRIASGFDQAILKVTSYGKDVKKVMSHIDYISRQNKVELEDEKGRVLLTKNDVENQVDTWQSIYFDNRVNTRHTFHFVLSVPPGTQRPRFREASKAFLIDEFGGKNEYLFAQHDDTEHPHIHVVVCLRGIDGKKLDPRKNMIHSMRKNFAKKCREKGIMLDASRRIERGISGKSVDKKIVQMRRKRGVVPEVDRQLLARIKDEMADQSLVVDTGIKVREERNKAMKSQFYDASKLLYKQYTNDPENPDYANNLKTAKLLFDYSKSMPDDKSRDELLKVKLHQNAMDYQQPDFLTLDKQQMKKEKEADIDIEY